MAWRLRVVLVGTASFAAATLALALVRPSAALACGCSYLGTHWVGPSAGSIAANSAFVLWDRGSLAGPPALTTALGEPVPLVEIANHASTGCGSFPLLRPSEPLVPGNAYNFFVDSSNSFPFTALPAEAPLIETPRFSVSVFETPAQRLEGTGCDAPKVERWYRVDVAFDQPGELTVFAWGNGGVVARVVNGQPPIGLPSCSEGECPPCPLCIARVDACLEVRAYALDGTLVGQGSFCEPNAPDSGAPSGTNDSGAGSGGCSLGGSSGRRGSGALVAALAFAFGALRRRRCGPRRHANISDGC